MSITSYSELQTAVSNFLDRSDMTARIPEWIALAEGRLRRELREWLRTTISASNVTADYVLPATVEAVTGVAMNDGVGGTYNRALDLISFQDWHDWLSGNSTVRAPVRGVYVDRDELNNTTTLRWYPPVSATSAIKVSIQVIGYLPALSDSAPSNRLLAAAPDAYLYAALSEASVYLQHDERTAAFEARAAEAVKALRLETERKLYGGQPRPVKLSVVFGESV